MAFGSESEDSEGVSLLVSKYSGNIDVNSENKSAAYWKSKENAEENDKKKYKCVVKGCTANFSRPWRLKAHLSIHAGKKPFPCDVEKCTKAYTSIYHLRRHKASAHEKPNSETSKPFKCEFTGCTAEFTLKQNARKHYRRTHQGRQCTECEQIFTKRSQLVAHQYDHTGLVPFKCKSCDAGFLRIGDLRRHERTHRDHICPEKSCFLAFKSWSEVRKHLINHPRNYVCILCRKSYLCRKNLKEHILKHSEPDKSEKRKTMLKRYDCELCSASLLGRASLKRHVSVVHEGGRGQKKDPSELQKKRALRKDKGSVKKSMAATLAEVKVPIEIEKKLLQDQESNTLHDKDLLDVVIHQVISTIPLISEDEEMSSEVLSLQRFASSQGSAEDSSN